MFLKKVETLEKLLNLRKKDIVTAVGSNGKTTFCLNLCKELKRKKKNIFFTTTVKILPVNKKYEFIDITILNTENETEEKISNKGPIVVCLDTSGSMKGTPLLRAKALVLSIIKILINISY